jgi:site-specific recombinase XerD
VIVLMLRLGLRASEVATLTLDDLDWRAGQITVHGKGSRIDRLPLPVDVGEAIAGYLRRGRPRTAAREVFVRVMQPRVGLTRSGVTSIVLGAAKRTGLGAVRAHRLRHTAASEMLRAGAPLTEIGQVLRHRSLGSTAAYARVDVERLRTIARPWPTGAAS